MGVWSPRRISPYARRCGQQEEECEGLKVFTEGWIVLRTPGHFDGLELRRLKFLQSSVLGTPSLPIWDGLQVRQPTTTVLATVDSSRRAEARRLKVWSVAGQATNRLSGPAYKREELHVAT